MRNVTLVGVVLAAGVLLVAGAASTEPAEGVPTFTKDVAPILYDNCVACHRPGEVTPMALLTYTDARPWSRAIKEKIMTREMPPWHADRRYGVFRNDPVLSADAIATIAA